MPEELLYKTYERAYYIDAEKKIFRKVEIPENVNIYGRRTTPWMSRERLANEHAALDLISNNTTIRVPKSHGLDYTDGCLSLTMELIPGKSLDDLPRKIRPAAVLKVNQYVTNIVLPQLAKLKSKRNGSLTRHIIPPRRVNEMFPGRSWMCKTATEKCFILCHNDLGQHNFLCDPETGDVLAVIDWEYSGIMIRYLSASSGCSHTIRLFTRKMRFFAWNSDYVELDLLAEWSALMLSRVTSYSSEPRRPG